MYACSQWFAVNGHINKVKLHLTRLVLGLVTIFGESTMPLFSTVGRYNEYTRDVFGHGRGRNGEFCVAVCPVTRTACIQAYCMLA